MYASGGGGQHWEMRSTYSVGNDNALEHGGPPRSWWLIVTDELWRASWELSTRERMHEETGARAISFLLGDWFTLVVRHRTVVLSLIHI